LLICGLRLGVAPQILKRIALAMPGSLHLGVKGQRMLVGHQHLAVALQTVERVALIMPSSSIATIETDSAIIGGERLLITT